MGYAVIEMRHLREFVSLLEFLEKLLGEIGDEKDESRLLILRLVVLPLVGDMKALCRKAQQIAT